MTTHPPVDWQPFREPLRATLTRTVAIALIAGLIVALRAGGIRYWPVISLLMLWPAVGGHWIELAFLNAVRPRLSRNVVVQRVARIAVWFVGGVLLGLAIRLTARAVLAHRTSLGLTWMIAGTGFVAIELFAHAMLSLRGRPSFYDGLG
jgi:hypothetical protein